MSVKVVECQILMIGENINVFPQQYGPKLLEGHHYCEYLLFNRSVIFLSMQQLTLIVGNWSTILHNARPQLII